MSTKYNFLAFDCGATSGRGILSTFEDGKFTMEEVYRFPNQALELDGKFYWNVFSIYEHFIKCLTELGKKRVRLDSIGIDTWGVDFGWVGEDGTLLSLPRSYRDPYTSGIPEEVFGIVSREDLYSVTGIQIMDFNSIFQLFAQGREDFASMKAAKHLLFMPDLLSYMLTGKKVCEYTIASTSGMMDLSSREFAGGILSALSLPGEKLLPISQSGTLIETLRPYIAEATGVGEVPVVAVAGHDTASAIAAVPASDEKFAYLSSGTWSLMGIEVPAPIINERSSALNFTNEGGIEGTTRFLKNITGMWLLEQCRKVWKKEGREYSYSELIDICKAEEDYPGIINPDDPRFANPADMPREIASALVERGYPAPENDGQMVRCIYHSLACRYKEVVDMLSSFAPFPIEKLHIIGGGSANTYMNQLTADTLGIPVVAGPTEATAIGNVMLQAVSAGLVHDRWEMRRLVAKAFEVKTYYPSK